MKTVETITVTKINKFGVSYSGSNHWSGTNIKNFPHPPKVGESFILTTEWGNPVQLPRITEVEYVSNSG